MAFAKEFLDQLRASVPVSEVVGRRMKLKKHGSEFRAIEDNSLTVNDTKGLWWDHARSKEGGDQFAWLTDKEGLSFPEAVEEMSKLAGLPMPNGAAGAPTSKAPALADDPPFDLDAYDLSRGSRATAAKPPERDITMTYDYTDAQGELLYQVVRQEWFADGKRKKTFLQRRPDGDGHWIWGLSAGEFVRARSGDWYQLNKDREKWLGERMTVAEAVPHGLYRLVEFNELKSDGEPAFILEGEKDVETARKWQLVATTNSGGAKNWSKDHAEHFRGLNVVIPVDNDEAGRKRGETIAQSLSGIAASIRILDWTGFWKDAPKGADLTDWRELEEGTREDLLKIVQKLPLWRPAPFVPTMGLRMWIDQNYGGRQYEFIIDDLIPERQVVVLMGDSGTGKSFLAFAMTMSLARGVPFFGRRVIRPMGVIWCAYEAADGASARMRAYREHHGLKLEPLPFGALEHPLPIWPNEPNGSLLINEIEGITSEHFGSSGLGAIVVDTYNAATPGASEIDSEVVSRIRTYFHRVVAKTGATLIIVGHTNSSGKHRGNEQLTNNVDTIIKVSMKTRLDGREIVQLKDDDGREIRTMKVVKQREGRRGAEFDFVLAAVKDGTKNRYGDDRTSCVVVPFGGSASPSPVAGNRGQKLTHERTVILQALRTAIEDHGEPTPATLNLPRSIARVVNAKRWKEIYIQKMPDPEGVADNTINKRLRDASAQFQHLGIIGRQNPFVWIVSGRNAAAEERPFFDDVPG